MIPIGLLALTVLLWTTGAKGYAAFVLIVSALATLAAN